MARRNLGGEDEWRRRIAAFKESGESFATFAAREGVSAESVRRWVRRFDDGPTTSRESVHLIEFVATRGRDAPLEAFEVLFANGHAIRVPHEFDAERLRVLVDVVGGSR